MPPSQCVKERQNIIDLGRTSTSVKIEAPVVLKPEQDSKKASAADEIAPEIKNGRAPITEQRSHAVDTIRNPSRTLNFVSAGFTPSRIIMPARAQLPLTSKKANLELSSL